MISLSIKGVHAEIDCRKACIKKGWEKAVEKETVGCQGYGFDACGVFCLTNQFYNIFAQQGFSAGKAHFGDAEAGKDLDDGVDFLIVQDRFLVGCIFMFFSHAVGAPEVASCSDGYACVIDGSVKGINQGVSLSAVTAHGVINGVLKTAKGACSDGRERRLLQFNKPELPLHRKVVVWQETDRFDGFVRCSVVLFHADLGAFQPRYGCFGVGIGGDHIIHASFRMIHDAENKSWFCGISVPQKAV